MTKRIFHGRVLKPLNTALLSSLLMLSSQAHGSSAFVGYEFGQMAFNDFQHFAGEVGYSFDNKSSIRLAFLNVALTERHLSSSEAGAVDGENIEGLWRGAGLLYDIPIATNFYFSPSIGHYDSEYSHTILNESIRKKSTTAGVGLTYRKHGLFGVNNLYWRFSLSYRHYFNPIPRTTLGESVVTGGSGEITPAIFVGYRFD